MAAERRSRINLYVGPGPTIALEGDGPEARTAFETKITALEDSSDYVFEEKKDGFWCLAVIEDGTIKSMVSRVGLAFEGTEVAGLLGKHVNETQTGSGRLVGELTADPIDGERIGVRRLHVFDVLDWNGIDLRDLHQIERREALSMVYGTFHDVARRNIHLVEQRTVGIVPWFYEILASGGEGIVAKKKTARCRATNADGKIEDWLRAKRKNSADLVVMAHGKAEKGTPNVDLGLYRGGKLVKVQTCTLPAAFAGVVVGAVVEVVGWEIFPSGAVRSGHIMRVRTDKLAEEC